MGDWNGTREVLDKLVAMDGVVNNAGEVIHISAINPALDCPKEVFDRSINIHLLGTINVIQMMGKKMVEVGKAGSIVNVSRYKTLFNSLVTNGPSHSHRVDESTFMFVSFFDENQKANRIAPDWTPRLAASHLGLFCLPMSHKKDAALIWVKSQLILFRGFRQGLTIPSKNHKRFYYLGIEE